ncbi:OmpA family protein [Pseudorhodoferax sp. Leaf267]|uniref:OmpA family protein n=1 Tax=Pseudorhodoferax sp. Leaf267 TaxID=1736316 RepID=UPI00138EDC46|nr:OmpA family protein [Pseudorhodoferax sp. Leaf267]
MKVPVQRIPAQDAPAPLARAQNGRQPTASLLSLQFPFASARLDATARTALRDVLPRLTAAPGITLVGHTDHTGPAAANERLARARAEAVLQALRSLAPGHAFQAHIDARGTCCFAASNDTPAGRARNRRVEIHLGLDPEDAP